MTSKSSPIKCSTPKTAAIGYVKKDMVWLYASSPILKPARLDSPTLPQTSRVEENNIEMELVSSDDEVFPARPIHNNKSAEKPKNLTDQPGTHGNKVRSATAVVKHTSQQIASNTIPTRGSKERTRQVSASDTCSQVIRGTSPQGIALLRRLISRDLSNPSSPTGIRSLELKVGRSDIHNSSVDQVKRRIDLESDRQESDVQHTAPVVRKSASPSKNVTFSPATDKMFNTGTGNNRKKATATVTNARKPSVAKDKARSANNSDVDVRRSKRSHVPTSAFWLGTPFSLDRSHSNSHKNTKTKHKQQTTMKRSAKRNVEIATSPKKRATTKVRTQTTRSWREESVCCATLADAAFTSCGEGDTGGVLRASTMSLHDMETEFITLPPGAATGDLCSLEDNQFYTVLVNTVSLEVDGVLKDFNLHGHFHVCRGLTHQVVNRSKLKSLVQVVKIHI